MFLNLYKCLVRPHLEYGSAAWAVKYKEKKLKSRTSNEEQINYYQKIKKKKKKLIIQ